MQHKIIKAAQREAKSNDGITSQHKNIDNTWN